MGIINFYMDDSGSRYLDRPSAKAQNREHDFFGLGGILIDDNDEFEARRLHQEFCERWSINYPLHSVDIRHKAKDFRWLGRLSTQELQEFFESLEDMLCRVPVVGIACIIDRPGYHQRYSELDQGQRWLLCKTAFCIAVERAAKYALAGKNRLRVLPERCSKKDDGRLRNYFEELRTTGPPFDVGRSYSYRPLSSEAFRDTLLEFRTKQKSSPLVQLADLYLWPIGKGGYIREYRPYKALYGAQKIMDAQLESKDVRTLGVKYSCFDF